MTLLVPRIVYRTSPRWFVISKPPAWHLSRRSETDTGSFVNDYLPTLVWGDISHIRFPIQVDSRYASLVVATTDRGMQSQFERFRIRNQIQYWYRMTLRGTQSTQTDICDDFAVECADVDPELGATTVEVKSSRYLKFVDLEAKFPGRVLPNMFVDIFRMRFPDPLNPRGEMVEIASNP
jgi:hypothetical protein